MSNEPILTLMPAAQAHFCALLVKAMESESDGAALHLRVEVSEPGTPHADVSITFCPAGEQEATDLELEYPHFIVYVEQKSVAALREAVIDFKPNENDLTGSNSGQLSVKAPYIKGVTPAQDASLRERVQYIIDSEINPNLAGHRGFVTLVNIVDNNKVIVRFGGGCHGCGMADVTLKSGIEKSLKQQCPEITAVLDVTDHALGENPYYIA